MEMSVKCPITVAAAAVDKEKFQIPKLKLQTNPKQKNLKREYRVELWMEARTAWLDRGRGVWICLLLLLLFIRVVDRVFGSCLKGIIVEATKERFRFGTSSNEMEHFRRRSREAGETLTNAVFSVQISGQVRVSSPPPPKSSSGGAGVVFYNGR
jgi:hypothetical protein